MNLEENILSALDTPENVAKIWGLGVREDHFLAPGNRACFSFALDYWYRSDRTLAPSREVLSYEFPGLKWVEPENSLDWLADAIKRRYRATAVTEAIEKAAKELDEDNPDAALQTLTANSWEIATKTTERRSVSSISESYPDVITRHSQRALDQRRGAPLGFTEIDDHTFGIMPGELAFGIGYAGTGKTWFAVKSAVEALAQGFKVYLHTLELSRQDIEDRTACILTDIPYGDLTKGHLNRGQIDALKSGRDILAAMGSDLIIDHSAPDERTVQSLLGKALVNRGPITLSWTNSHLSSPGGTMRSQMNR